MKPLILITVILLLSACNYTSYDYDKDLQTELFFKCLENVPESPESTVYNDRAEVIAECRDTSKSLSWRCVEGCM